MSNIWAYIRQLVGNGKAATVGIFAFIVVLCLLFFHKAHAAEVDLQAGSSFGTQGTGPVLGLQFGAPIQPGLNFIAGTDLWGSTTYHGFTVPNNWDWHAGLQGCKWRFCADIGPAYVQRIDAINGAHTNFHLGLSLSLTDRLKIVLGHISDAGTSDPNVGRQALSLSYRLQ
jgi:Lipid A 3-O-deacylase (PagL)